MPRRGSRIGLTSSRWEILAIARRWVEGLFELRIDWGPGYRIYYAMIGRTCVLLCGGDKRKQASEIRRARDYFKDYLQRTRIQ